MTQLNNQETKLKMTFTAKSGKEKTTSKDDTSLKKATDHVNEKASNTGKN